ncbi:MAG: T9SS type A sorting domain-containing protein, partial [Calditrichia bacterium]|nr:T9SS type A sorting domain-containing protein [Calditrichia bacterium]
KKKDPLSAVYFDIPYVNQRYDTPDWFNGNSACGATAASQCLSYFGLLKQWPVWVSTPYPHISDYGNYICEIYTYNGYTFNIGGRDPNGTIGYGGFGYIIRNNWYNTKGYMRDYAIIHGLSSAVDWNPTRGKLATEITNEDPFVLLNSLTSAGHYISVIGYDNTDTTTVIVNDPYGDKNQGYANFYGRRAWYDWPGYNNGNENLNTVHCYIYFRGNPPADIVVQNFTVQVDTAAVCQNVFVSAEIANIGRLTSVASTIEFFVSENGIHDENAYILNTFPLPALNVGQIHTLQDSIALPDSLISDTYKLSVFADADTINREMLKDNNVISVNIVLNGYPRLYGILPEANSVINNQRPAIRVKYQDWITKIDTANVKLYLDNFNITDSSIVGIRRIDYTPGYDLLEGLHQLRVEVPSNLGLMATYNWDFEIQLASKLDDITSFNPNEFYLAQNYPNPFNPNTTIEFNLLKNGNISVNVYDLNGKLVTELVKYEYYKTGYHKLSFDAGSLASGIYIYTLKTERNSLTRKMLLLR